MSLTGSVGGVKHGFLSLKYTCSDVALFDCDQKDDLQQCVCVCVRSTTRQDVLYMYKYIVSESEEY